MGLSLLYLLDQLEMQVQPEASVEKKDEDLYQYNLPSWRNW